MCSRNSRAAVVHFGDTPFRELDDRSWNASRRIEDMDRHGVGVQVLSPMPELLSYWFPNSAAAAIADYMNGVIAALIAAAPHRFRGLGMVPMQDVHMAITGLERLREQFGLDGIEIGSHINGEMLGSERFDPIWEAAAALDLAIFVHPLHPLTTKLNGVDGAFHPLVGFLNEGAIAGSSLLLAGVLDRFPTLRVGFTHGGGGLMSAIPRLDQAWKTMPQVQKTLSRLPSEQAARLFVDSNVYDTEYLKYLVTVAAPGRVFVGTDYPYQIMQDAPAAYIRSADLSSGDLAVLTRTAALTFLGLSAA